VFVNNFGTSLDGYMEKDKKKKKRKKLSRIYVKQIFLIFYSSTLLSI